MFSGIKTQVFEKGPQSGIFWKRALSVFVWTDANAGFRITWCHTSYSACPVRDAIDRIFRFRDDWNTLHVDAYFFKTEKKKFRLDTCWRRLSLLQKIDCCITPHCCRRYTEKNYYITIHIKVCNRLHLHWRHYKILHCIKLYILLSKNSTDYLLVKDGKSLRRI